MFSTQWYSEFLDRSRRAVMVVQLQMVWMFFVARANRLREENPDRGEIVNAAIVIGVLAAGAIIVGAILITKAKDAANNVKTQ